MSNGKSLSALEKLRQTTASVIIQKNVRRYQHHQYVVNLAMSSWEKLIDHKNSAHFYYNRISGLTQWFKPMLLKKKRLVLNETFNYYTTNEYMTSRYRINQIPKVNPVDFLFDESWMNAPELDEKQYSVIKVDPSILVPPGEIWNPTPTTKKDFGDTGLLTKTTGDTDPWDCPKCKYTNRPGVLICDICGFNCPPEIGKKAEDMMPKKPIQTVPWSYPIEDTKDIMNEQKQDPEESLALDQARQLLLSLDHEHGDTSSSSSSSSNDSSYSSDSDSDESIDGNFGIQPPKNMYVVFNPPLKPMDSHLVRLRNTNQRERFRANQRVLRQKEEIVMMSCEQALDSSSMGTVHNAIKMADALINAVGIHVIHSDLIRTFVELRKWAKTIGLKKKYSQGKYPEKNRKDPNFHPCSWRRKDLVNEYIKLDTTTPRCKKKKKSKKNNSRKNEQIFNRKNVLNHSRDGPFEADIDKKVKRTTTKNIENIIIKMKDEKIKDEFDENKIEKNEMEKNKIDEKNQDQKESIFGSLGGATEMEIQAANSIIFGSHVKGAKKGRLIRINVHIGPGDHLGQRYSVTEGDPKLEEGYSQILSFAAWSFQYPGTIRYDVYTKTEPVWRSKIVSDQVTKTRHKPEARKLLVAAPVAADDKELGWTHELTFYAFYHPGNYIIFVLPVPNFNCNKCNHYYLFFYFHFFSHLQIYFTLYIVNASCRYYVSEMWNPYRNKLTLSNARGGWTPLFNFFSFPLRMYNVFKLTRPRARPNEGKKEKLLSKHALHAP
jgi:hypothetical protein